MTDSDLYTENKNIFPNGGKILLYVVLIVLAIMLLNGCLTTKKACREWAEATYKPDTKYVKEYIYVPEIKVETELVMKHDSLIEHFFIDKERLHIEIKRVRDTLIVKGRCDSIVKEVVKTVYVSVSQPCTEDEGQWCLEKWWLWVVLAGLGLACLVGVALKIKNI
jgi:hypothetical protein